MKNTIYIMVGLPGSGKSTFIKNHLGHCDFVVDIDSFIEDHAALQDMTYNEIFSSHIKYATRFMWQTWNNVKRFELEKNKLEGLKVVWDQTNLTAVKRKKILDTVPEHWRKVAVVVHSENYREDSNRQGKSIPADVMDRLEDSFEVPSTEEGFDEIMVHLREDL